MDTDTPKKRKHLRYSYFDLAEAMEYSHSYLMSELSKLGLSPRNMPLYDLACLIILSGNPRGNHYLQRLQHLRQQIEDRLSIPH